MAVDQFSGTSALADQVQTAYDRNAYFGLRTMPVFDQFVDVKPGNVTSPGSAVQFLLWTEMTAATTALTETVDVDAVALADTTVTVTPSEYGNAILVTLKVEKDTLLVGFDPDLANLLTYNMVISQDTIARTAFDAAGTAAYVTGSAETSQTTTSIITADIVRRERSNLVNSAVRPWTGSLYAALVHPDVGYDLKGETGDGTWVAPHQYVDTAAIYNDEIGTFGGFKFVETSRASVNLTGGTGSTVDTYNTYFLGQQAVAKAEPIAPHAVIGPVTDKLLRFRPLGWHAYMGYGTFRTASMQNLLSASSLGGA